MSIRPDSAGNGGAAEGGAALAARRRRPPAYLLEQSQNVVIGEGEEPEHYFELSPCGCDCWYCSDCCTRKGYNLRVLLVPVLETFRALMMITLTIDPDLFPSPKEAYLYVKKKRCISRLMRELDKAGHLHSRRYFYVLEFQERTEQAHFHVLTDASYIPKGAIDTAWSRFRPRWAAPVAANRPAFGMTRFSMPTFEGGALHAARYATKYLVKTPAYGFPSWVLGMGRENRVPRYQTSHGFWGREPQEVNPNPKKRKQNPRTYADRLDDCATTSNVFESMEFVDEETGEVLRQRLWRARLNLSETNLRAIIKEEQGARPKIRVIAKNPASMIDVLQAASGETVQVVSGYGWGGGRR